MNFAIMLHLLDSPPLQMVTTRIWQQKSRVAKIFDISATRLSR